MVFSSQVITSFAYFFAVVTSRAHKNTTRNMETSRLLSLPAEIRNQIWAHLLEDHHIHLRYADCRPNEPHFYVHTLPRDRHPLTPGEINHHSSPSKSFDKITPVWLVNKQMYAETINMPFSGSNAFSFEDEFVLRHFMSRTTPEQIEGISSIWIGENAQSAPMIELLASRLKALRRESRLCPKTTIYIPSRRSKLEVAAGDQRAGATNITERLRAGWELTSERQQVAGLQDLWEKLVERVVVVEI